MTDTKFTDEEIIKALECHIKAEDCEGCEMFGGCEEIILTERVLDLINRQKAEIEKLKKENEILSRNSDNAFQEGLNERRELFEPEIKAEAYKEFAERLIEEIHLRPTYSREQDKNVIHIISNLIEEMVGYL